MKINNVLKNLAFVAILSASIFKADACFAVSRIKDIADFEGVRDNQLIGYGLIVGIVCENRLEFIKLLFKLVESCGHLGVSGLDLYVTNHIVLAAEVEEVFHKGKLGALEVGGELTSEVEIEELLVGVIGNEALTVGGAVDLFIMEGYDLAVSGEVYVGLNTVSLHLSCELVSGHGVFGRICGSSAVRDNEGAFCKCLCHFSLFLSDNLFFIL